MIQISVIVPVYNVEKYLSKCIDSLINQTFKSLQIILVDDGSTDSSGAICDEYASKNRCIEVIHKKNGGLSSARNAGLEKAVGRYIAFVDSDDWIHSKMYEKLYSLAEKYNSDIVQCRYKRVEKDEDKEEKLYESSIEIYKNIEVLNNYYDDKCTEKYIESVIVCNKLYKRKLFENIYFPIGKVYEDEFITHKVIYKANKVVRTGDIMYFYRNTNNSITNRKFNSSKLFFLEALEERCKFFKDNNEEELYDKTLNKYGKMIKIYYSKCKFLIENNHTILKQLKKRYREVFSIYIKNNCLSTGDIICSYIFYIMPNLYALMIKVRGKYNINIK